MISTVEKTDLHERFAENLKAIRKSKGMTQIELAERLEIQQGYLSELERAKKPASLAMIARMAEVLGVDPSEFLAKESPIAP